MHFYPNERLALFIDGANLYATAKALGFDIDYKRLLALSYQGSASARAVLHGAGRGSGVLVDPSPRRLARLQRLHDGDQAHQGIHRRAGRRKIKGNMDIELTVDAMRLVEHLDHVVLFTGDGDFRALVAALQMRGRTVSVVSTLQTQPPMVADELRRQADQFIDLADLEDQICRDPATRPAPGTRVARRPSPAPAAATLEYPDDDEEVR